ncbi:hypothetical protein AVEN_68540-1 [Araneus ventricosus]|uniref:Endonuclease/exonuclease/phosphatase domain-containing protein n=1 Tax=Araneus ventricosus TaxID=182803 RepID=A0A4Y2HCR0_ARAVE|nr:hypothetical protein AVEN_68540-1 [Araneus ventricosus]
MKMYISTDTIGVIIKYRNLNLLVISVYCPPREDINIIVSELENCLQHPHDRFIIMGDFNSKIPVWGSDIEDERGCELQEFALSKGLAVVNDETTIPTFEGSQGRSWVDITICDP